MKKTTVKVRGFDCDFEITLLKKEHLSIQSAEEYVHKEIVSTAFIREVVHHDKEGDYTIVNENYIKPSYERKEN